MKYIYITLLSLLVWACESPNKQETTATEVETQKEPESISKEDSLLNSINQKIRNDIGNKDLYLKRADYFLDLDDQQSALEDINRAFKLDTTYLPTLLKQANFLAKNGKLELSERILNKANRLYPENSEVHTQYSTIYLIGKSNKKSLKHADLAVKYDIYNAEAYYLKGYNFLEMGDTAKAISSYRTAVEQDPDFFKAYLELGYVFSAQNDPIALDYYNNALEIRPYDKSVLYSKGMYEQEHEMYNEAMKSYTKAIKKYPNFKEAHHNLGYVHMYYLKLYKESIPHFTDAIKVDNRYFQAYYNRGYAFELMGDINNAAKDYRKALEILPTYDLAAQGLSRVQN